MKLLDRVRNTLRLRHLGRKTEKAYTQWIIRFLRFHASPGEDGKPVWKHPEQMGEAEVRDFLLAFAALGLLPPSCDRRPAIAAGRPRAS
ncbi:MAG: phage integrase N-terminal SAM-like domain-containing protein [Phycisphaeraceae bacterium]